MIEVELAQALGAGGGEPLALELLPGRELVARCGGSRGAGPDEPSARRDLVLALLARVDEQRDELERAAERARAWLAGSSGPQPHVAERAAPAAPSWRALAIEPTTIPPGTPQIVPISSSARFSPERLALEHPERWYVLRIDHDGRSCLGVPGPVDGFQFGEDGGEPVPVAWPTLLPDGPSILLYVANRTPEPQTLRGVLWGEGDPIELPPPPGPADRFEELLAAAQPVGALPDSAIGAPSGSRP